MSKAVIRPIKKPGGSLKTVRLILIEGQLLAVLYTTLP